MSKKSFFPLVFLIALILNGCAGAVPATQGGNPVAGAVTFPVQFKLQ